MSNKNEIKIYILSFVISIALIGSGYWWLTKNFSGSFNSMLNSQIKDDEYRNKNKIPKIFSKNYFNSTFTSIENVPTGIFNYGGSTSWAPIRQIIDPQIRAARPEFTLHYMESNNNKRGSGTGIKMLIDGQLAFAQSSRPVSDDEFERARRRDFSLTQIPVAIDGLAIVVNPELNINGLSLEHLKSIYTGETTNWNQLGGSNIPIQPFSRHKNEGGTVKMFVEDILGGQPFSSQVKLVSTTTQALNQIAQKPGGIYFASAPEVVPQCSVKTLPLRRKQGKYVAPYQGRLVLPSECPGKRNKLNIEAFQSGSYPITRNLFVVVKQNGRIEEQAGKTYGKFLLTEQGQELISRYGF